MADETLGVLAIFNNAVSGREAEFEAWVQGEHLAERIAVPGFLLGRRYEAVSGQPRYFTYYITQSTSVFKSPAYLARLDQPTPLTRTVMSEIFADMNRTVCHRAYRKGVMTGACAVALRFTSTPDEAALRSRLDRLANEKEVAGGEIWQAASREEFPVSAEEQLRGGDRRIESCLLIETLRICDAEELAARLSAEFPQAETNVYRLLCELRSPIAHIPRG